MQVHVHSGPLGLGNVGKSGLSANILKTSGFPLLCEPQRRGALLQGMGRWHMVLMGMPPLFIELLLCADHIWKGLHISRGTHFPTYSSQ